MKAMFFTSLDKCTTINNLDENLRRFWDLETLGISENEQHFHENFTIYLNEENIYEARFSFKETRPSLQDHYKLSGFMFS